MSARYRVFTIKREHKLKERLNKIENAFQLSTDSTFTKVYGKSAIMELAVFIEESINLLCEKITKRIEVENKNLFDVYHNTGYRQPIKYDGVVKRLLPVYGIDRIAKAESKIGDTDIQALKIELGNINSWRQTIAHSDLTVPANPNKVFSSFNKILPIFRKIELALRG